LTLGTEDRAFGEWNFPSPFSSSSFFFPAARGCLETKGPFTPLFVPISSLRSAKVNTSISDSNPSSPPSLPFRADDFFRSHLCAEADQETHYSTCPPFLFFSPLFFFLPLYALRQGLGVILNEQGYAVSPFMRVRPDLDRGSTRTRREDWTRRASRTSPFLLLSPPSLSPPTQKNLKLGHVVIGKPGTARVVPSRRVRGCNPLVWSGRVIAGIVSTRNRPSPLFLPLFFFPSPGAW